MVKNKSGWQWDESQAVESSGEQAQNEMDEILTRAAGTATVDDAEAVLLGRPRVQEPRETTVKIQVRVPQSWQREIDRKAAGRHLSRSQYLRQLIRHDAQQKTA
ncbi:MAG: ribbon-helix-helix domain-containing protein [Bifidobacteriaceae bacterium]|nr:ribbon-helix-helix domain-containing protein [Bifidobacteriaceae bacterium]MCI1914917.1 ribbon-helix-helix domain-containing protein [Bifidobacteriaceae bacterium]